MVRQQPCLPNNCGCSRITLLHVAGSFLHHGKDGKFHSPVFSDKKYTVARSEAETSVYGKNCLWQFASPQDSDFQFP